LPYSLDYPPPDYVDPVIEAYKKDVDRTVLRENLKLTHAERLQKAKDVHASVERWRGAARADVVAFGRKP
jgi:hypothetical protein